MARILKLLVLTILASCNSFSRLDIWKVYYLGGQSNMDGYGYNSQLPDSLKKKIPNSMIFNGKRDNEGSLNGGIGIWSPVQTTFLKCLVQSFLLQKK